MGSAQGTVQDVEVGLNIAGQMWPLFAALVSMFNPKAGAALMQAHPLIQAAAQATDRVAQQAGISPPQAVSHVVDHINGLQQNSA